MKHLNGGELVALAVMGALLLAAVVSVLWTMIRAAVHGLPQEEETLPRVARRDSHAQTSDIWARGSAYHLLSRRMAGHPPMHRRVEGLPPTHNEADFHDPRTGSR